MNSLSRNPAVALLALVTVTGCESGHDAKLQEDLRSERLVADGIVGELHWRVEQGYASQIFNMNQYLAFRKCHEEPPTHDANKRICAALQARVAEQEAKTDAKARAEKAAW